jgi:two-component system sensor histidine kinase QseC
VRIVGIAFMPQLEPVKPGRMKAGKPRGNQLHALLVFARSRRELDFTLSVLLLAIGGTGLVLPIGIALIVQSLVKQGLRPLDRVASEAAAIDSRSLQHRFPVAELPLELQPICQRLNDLLERIQAAFARERRFTGDVAHELRTPIAELYSLTEVALMCSEDEPLNQSTVREALIIARQMDRLVSALLALARCEAGIQKMTCESIQLHEALEQVWMSYAGRASLRGLAHTAEIASGLCIRTDRAMLLSVLGNLFSNAIDHAPEGGRIDIRAGSSGKTVVLSIRNTHEGLTDEDLPHLLEPFWQKDAARTDSTHSGLGLSLVAAFCRLMDVPLSLKLNGNDEFAVELTFLG